MKNRINVAALALGLTLWASAGAALATTSSQLNDTAALTVTGYTNTGTGGALVEKTPAWYYGGYGITSAGESSYQPPQHAADNNGYQEALLLDFGAYTKLESVKIGWPSSGYDTDITVLAWNPGVPGAADPVLVGYEYSDLIGLGWSLVGHYHNLGTSSAKIVNSQNSVSSSHWLVMAYNNTFASSSPSDNSSTSPTATNRWGQKYLDPNNDYVKFLSVSYSTTTPPDNSVPEPSTALLLGAAMFGLVGWRNRRNVVR